MSDSIRVVIVDDEPLAIERIRDLLSVEPGIEILGEAGEGAEAVRLIKSRRPDLLFLDVQMPGMDGFAVLRKLRGDRVPVTIFVTAHDQHAVRAFEANALDYILKPFKRSRFRAALERARAVLEQEQNEEIAGRISALLESLEPSSTGLERIPVKVGRKILIVKAETIDWIGAEDNYVRLHVAEKSYLLRETMSSMEKQLDPRRFQRIHRATIVNIDRVRELRPWFNRDFKVILADGTDLILSRGYRKQADRLFTHR